MFRRVLFRSAGGTWYNIRHAAVQAEANASVNVPTVVTGTTTSASSTVIQSKSPLGDMSLFRTITQDTLDKLNAGDQSGATTRIGDLEYEWDNAQSRLKSRDKTEWTKVDGKIDTVLRELRAVSPNKTSEVSALQALLVVLQ